MGCYSLIERELRLAARRPGTYWGRLGSAVLVIFFGLMILMPSGTSLVNRTMGAQLFNILTWFALVQSSLVYARLAADCISSERREGTLGLLFLAPVKGRDVIFGKLCAIGLPGLYAILVFIPLLSVALAFGGITGARLAQTSIGLIGTLFFSLSLSILVSTFASDQQKATQQAVGLLMLIALVPPGLTVGCRVLGWTGWQAEWAGYLCWISPIDLCFRAAGTPTFWMGLVIQHVLGWCMLGLACRAVRSRIDPPASRSRSGQRNGLQMESDSLRRWRQGLLDRNALTWLACRKPWRILASWVPLILSLVLWAIGYHYLQKDLWRIEVCLPLIFYLSALLKFLLASEATQRFRADYESGALDLVLSTSLTVKEIASGHRLALWLQFRVMIVTVSVILGLLMAGAWGMREAVGSTMSVGELLACSLAILALLPLDLWALSWEGLWLSIQQAGVRQKSRNSGGLVLLGPWLSMGLIHLLWGWATWLWNWNFSPGFGSFLFLWVVLSVVFDVKVARRSQLKLQTQFRIRALQRYDQDLINRHSFFFRLGQWFGHLQVSSKKKPFPGNAR